jgi:hypothetical protein
MVESWVGDVRRQAEAGSGLPFEGSVMIRKNYRKMTVILGARNCGCHSAIRKGSRLKLPSTSKRATFKWKRLVASQKRPRVIPTRKA